MTARRPTAARRSKGFGFGSLLLLAAAPALGACSGPSPVEQDGTGPTVTADTLPLRYHAEARGRYVGAAVGSALTMPNDSGARLRAILAREFDMVWTGRFMKFDHLRPDRWTYDYAQADSVVAYAHRNGMVVRGHTLVWHEQVPAWVTDGGFPPDTLAAILRDHVERVVGHFKGELVAWDVVNEAIADDGTLRPTPWLNVGTDYVERAFRWARDADPDVPLFYNDYGIEVVNTKSDAVYALLSDLKARGVPIDGIGFQFHYQADGAPAAERIVTNFARFASLGLEIQITEADMHVPVLNGLPSAADLQVQAGAYREMTSACLRTPACDAVEIEGIYDGEAWVSDPASWGAPVLFDVFMRPKPAYYAVQAALAGR
jgi:endo-1,4-beta-xylanase